MVVLLTLLVVSQISSCHALDLASVAEFEVTRRLGAIGRCYKRGLESRQQIDHFPLGFELELTRFFLVIASFC